MITNILFKSKILNKYNKTYLISNIFIFEEESVATIKLLTDIIDSRVSHKALLNSEILLILTLSLFGSRLNKTISE